jgi:hypothetical protein
MLHLQSLEDILTWMFALMSLNTILTILFANLAVFLHAIFIEIVCGVIIAIYLIKRISDPLPRAFRYSRCYNGYRDPQLAPNQNGDTSDRQLTFEEKDVAREL